MQQIDLNADIGESYGAWRMGNDAALVPLLSSANIACGFHAGDPRVMAASVALCRAHGVLIGAHPSYPDRQGFGRRHMQLSTEQIHHDVLYQIGALAAFAGAQQTRLQHVKPHGALYNLAATDRPVAAAIVAAVRDFDPQLAVVGLAGSCLLEAATDAGMRALAEGFVDRRYAASGTLVPRSDPRALIEDGAEALAQALHLCRGTAFAAVDGQPLALRADTLCIHGDGEHAVQFAHTLRAGLQAQGVTVRAVSE